MKVWKLGRRPAVGVGRQCSAFAVLAGSGRHPESLVVFCHRVRKQQCRVTAHKSRLMREDWYSAVYKRPTVRSTALQVMTAKKAARCKKSRTGVTPNGFFMRLPGSGSAAALHNLSERKWLHSRREAAGERNEQKLTAVFRLTITSFQQSFSAVGTPSVRLDPCFFRRSANTYSAGRLRSTCLEFNFVPYTSLGLIHRNKFAGFDLVQCC